MFVLICQLLFKLISPLRPLVKQSVNISEISIITGYLKYLDLLKAPV